MGSAFEPALMDKYLQHAAAPAEQCPYGGYEAMLETLCAQLRRGPYLLGDSFTAADILWSTALAWTTMFKLVPERPEIMAYIARTSDRPAFTRVRAEDAELAKAQEAEVASSS